MVQMSQNVCWSKEEGGIRVCGDAVLLDLWKFLFYVEVLRFYKTKQFVVLTQFWGTCSLRFSVVILCGVYI